MVFAKGKLSSKACVSSVKASSEQRPLSRRSPTHTCSGTGTGVPRPYSSSLRPSGDPPGPLTRRGPPPGGRAAAPGAGKPNAPGRAPARRPPHEMAGGRRRYLSALTGGLRSRITATAAAFLAYCAMPAPCHRRTRPWGPGRSWGRARSGGGPFSCRLP